MTFSAFAWRAAAFGLAATLICMTLLYLVPVLGIILGLILCPPMLGYAAVKHYWPYWFGAPLPLGSDLATYLLAVAITNAAIYLLLGSFFRWGENWPVFWLVPLLAICAYIFAFLGGYIPIPH